MPANPLTQALAAGDPQAYAALYDRLGGRMFRVAMLLLRDRQEAEDAVQDVFVSLVRSRHRLLGVDDLEAYVFSIVRHMAARRGLRRTAEQKTIRALAENPPVEPGSDGSEADADALALAVGALPQEQREVIALKVDAGLTFAQIAQVLEISANTAASRYRYAVERLRRTLEGDS